MCSIVFFCVRLMRHWCVGGDVNCGVRAPIGVLVEARDKCLVSSVVSIYLIFWTLTFLLG